MASVSVQDYLQTIYRLQQAGHPSVSTTALAAQLGVAPASVTDMIQKLHRQGLVEHTPYQGVSLNEAGEVEALRMIRRHRLWELFLTEVLGMPWDEVHEEAHRLEHATSDRVMERLAAFLHEPKWDPHGQRIPARDGTLAEQPALSLENAPAGATVRIVEVPDGDPALLRTLGELGLYPGTEVTLAPGAPAPDPLTLHIGASTRGLERAVARRILVERVSATDH